VSVNVKFNVRHQETGKAYSKVLTHIALTNAPFINGLRAFERKLAASNGEIPDDSDVLVSYELEADDATWLALTDVWDPERDWTYVREQIEALLHGSFALDNDGELFDMRDGSSSEEATPANVFVIGMTNDQVLLTAHARSDAEQAMVELRERNGDCEGWVAGFTLEDDGEVVLDPIDEWQQVRRGWMEMSREFTLMDSLPISGGDELTLRSVSTDERDKLAKGGKALPDGSFPIASVSDLRNAIKAYGRAKNKAAAKRHIIKRAKALGRTDLLPEEWSASIEEELEQMSAGNTTAESPRGGDGMADGNAPEGTTPEPEPVAPEVEPQASFTREDLDRIADERAQAALEAYRQEQRQQEENRDAELAAARNQLHEMAVRERVSELETAGHAPAVIQLAREFMLADVRHESMLSLSREEGEVQVSATDMITELLGALPPTALTRTDENYVPVPNPSANGDDVNARADRIEAVLKGE
jgi:hypothetical protein